MNILDVRAFSIWSDIRRSTSLRGRVRGVLDAGATRLGLHARDGGENAVASAIDHTLLKPDATAGDIETCAAKRRSGSSPPSA